MKSTIKIHEFLGFQFITGTISIEDVVKQPDLSPRTGRPQNFFERCPAPVRQYNAPDAPFKSDGAYFQECYLLVPEVVEILDQIPEVRNEFKMYTGLDRLGRTVHYSVTPAFRNVKRQETAEDRVKEANEEFDRWLREDKDEMIRLECQGLLDMIHSVLEKTNEKNARMIAKDSIENMGNPGFYKPDEKDSEKGDAEVVRINSELKEIRERIRELEKQKSDRHRQLCREWLDTETRAPAEILSRIREQCESMKPGFSPPHIR